MEHNREDKQGEDRTMLMPMKVEDKEEGEDDSEKKRCQIFELKTFGHKFIDYFCKYCCQCIYNRT